MLKATLNWLEKKFKERKGLFQQSYLLQLCYHTIINICLRIIDA